MAAKKPEQVMECVEAFACNDPHGVPYGVRLGERFPESHWAPQRYPQWFAPFGASREQLADHKRRHGR